MKGLFYIIVIFIAWIPVLHGQSAIHYTPEQQAMFDTLQAQIDQLQDVLYIQQNRMDASMYFTKKELEKLIFIKAYEEYVINEELDEALSLTQTKIEDSRKRKDQESIAFYTKYEKRWYEEVRLQRLKYQKLFEKEKNFRKEFDKYIKLQTVEGYEKAKQITVLAIKYAMETGGHENTIVYLHNYWKLADAMEYDLNLPFNLEKLTAREKSFEKVFQPLVTSDSLHHIEEAGKILEHCITYSTYTSRPLKPAYFIKKKNVVAAALSDYYDRLGGKVDLSKLTDRAITLRLDTLNPYGIYKWGQYIIVIHHMNPRSTSVSVRLGEAIIKADLQLVKYITLNRLGEIKESDKMGYTFLIPFFYNDTRDYFFYDQDVDAFQFMVCYTMVVNPDFMKKVIKYMPPIQFVEEIEAESNTSKQ